MKAQREVVVSAVLAFHGSHDAKVLSVESFKRLQKHGKPLRLHKQSE